MYSKIAVGNVKKSFKDYTIYFLTLTLAVCIFYSFNSIESQKALLEMSSSQKQYASTLTQIISYVSVFVSIILGSLIIYANNFLIKKRNKELGIYMILGMGKRKISRILIIETLIVGVMSLIGGLLLGFVASQGLSVLVSKLFEVEMSQYTFTISGYSIGKTILYFGIMFLLVIVFNTYIISKYKIIDLLTCGRKTQDVKFKNPIIYLISFILCIGCLGIAYKFILDIGLDVGNPKFILSIILGIIGTVLFFFSLAGFILYMVKKNKRVYFKGLNIFVAKQINSKVNTNFISMSVITLMLFITICVLSSGISFKNAIESGLKNSTPYDASATLYVSEGNNVTNIEESIKNTGFKFDNNEKYAFYNEYYADVNIKDIITSVSDKNFGNTNISFVRISDYNKMRELQGKEKIILEGNEVLLSSNFEKVLPAIKEYLKNNDKVIIKGSTYTIKNQEIIEENLNTYFMQNNIFTVIINDEFCNDAKLSTSNINVNFSNENIDETEAKYVELFKSYKYGKFDFDETGFINGTTRVQVYEESKGMTTTILFVGIYLGIVFLISSMAVLALQQLCEASDSIERYKSLRRIGANEKSINKTIFYQTMIYFSIPIALALVHSIVGIKVANNFIAMYNSPDIGNTSIFTAGIFLIVYSIYFYATYTGYKNIVKSKIK